MRAPLMGFVALATAYGCGARELPVDRRPGAAPAAGTSTAEPVTSGAPGRPEGKAPCPYLPTPEVLAESDKRGYALRGDSELATCDVRPSTFIVHVIDADERPVAGVPLAVGRYAADTGALSPLAIGTADAQGTATFRVEPADRYAVLAHYENGRFAAQLMVPSLHGVDVRLHVVPPTNDLDATKIATQSNVYVERKGDYFEFLETITAFNFGDNALLADWTIALPKGAESFQAEGFPEQLHSELTGDGRVRLVDTIAPREHDATFTFKVRVASGRDQTFDLGLPPRAAQAAVMYLTEDPNGLVVADAPPPEAKASKTGDHALLAKQTLSNDGKRHTLHFTLRVAK